MSSIGPYTTAMSLLVFALTTVLAATVIYSERCTSPTSSRLHLQISSHRNEAGHFIISANTERSLRTGVTPRLLVDIHHDIESCEEVELETLSSTATVDPQQGGRTAPHDQGSLTTLIPTSTSPTDTTSATAEQTTQKLTTTAPSGYELFPGLGWYKPYKEQLAWSAARARCVQDGADLMAIETRREKKEVFDKYYGSLPNYPWLGVYDPGHNGTWMTVRGEPASSSWWYPGEPNNAGAFCCDTGSNGLLYDNYCQHTTTFICEKPE